MPMKNIIDEFEAILIDLNKSNIGRRAFLASVPLLMAACASKSIRPKENDSEILTIDGEKSEQLSDRVKDCFAETACREGLSTPL